MKRAGDREKIKNLLTRAISKVVVRNHLESRLKSGEKLRIKFGIDPTAPDIHLGHTVPLLKLRQFQDLGHKSILIIGDFTARIGDPTGRNEARKLLSESEVKKNMTNYLNQAGKIIDIKKTEIYYNTEWFGKMSARDFFELAGKVTVQQVLKRADFKKRIKSDVDINTNEVMYPLFQGYDSVMVKADVEIGGEDQLLNLLMGRRVQRAYNIPEQDILTTWLIEGTDGVKKMSKSSGNYIGITEKPNIMFGKIMSIPDSLIIKYFRALTMIVDSEIDKFEIELKSKKTNPRDIKAELAYEIVRMYHGEKSAKEADEEFERVFKKHQLPENIPEVSITIKPRKIEEVLMQLHFTSSRSEARRLILANAVRADGKVINNINTIINVFPGMIVQVGKKRFVKIRIK